MNKNVQLRLAALAMAPAALALAAGVPAGMELAWADEFEYVGAPDPAKWTHEVGGGGWGNGEVQTYTNSLDNSRVEGGRLIIEARQNREGTRVPSYTSARLVTREKAQWKYGRFEIRAKMPSETGTWSALWMLAADRLHSFAGWPDNGEIDIMEHVGYEEDPLFKAITGNPSQPNVHGTLHTFMRNGRDNQGIGSRTYRPDVSSAFHVHAVNWLEDRIEFEIDGVIYHTIYRADLIPARNPPADPWQYWPFNQRFFLILNIAIGGDWGGHFNSTYYGAQCPYGSDGIDHNGVWPQRLEVDYVRVYTYPAVAVPDPVPGQVNATGMDNSQGVLLQKSQNPDSPHNMANIDAGDWAEFAVQAAQAGTYTLSAAVATAAGGKWLEVTIPGTGTGPGPVALPATGGWQIWQTVQLGTVALQQGVNTLRLETNTGGFNIAWLRLEGPTGGVWKGLVTDAYGNANTNSWLGWINVTYAPWIYSYSLGKYIYPLAALEETFHTDSQWIYIPRE